MKTTLTNRQLNEIRNADKRLSHRPIEVRASFIRDYLKLRISEAELIKVIASQRLEHLRAEILAERISYGEIAELESLASFIEPDDTLLLEWAGVPENTTTT